jgi:transcriptional regulator with XRE-family HTH domain
MSKKLSARIRELREARGLSASDLARSVGVTPTAVWNWEKNGIKPRSDALAAISDALGVTTNYLLTGDSGNDDQSRRTVAHILDEAQAEIAVATGLAPERVRIHVEFLPG